MKKIGIFLVCALLFTLTSCDNEPLEDDFPENGETSCTVAVAETTQAAINFSVANVDTYTQLCTVYRNALIAQSQICGDDDGSLDLIVSGLGDCSQVVIDDCESATAIVVATQQAFDNATDANFTSFCNAYKTALENQILICGDDNDNIQSIIDSLGDCTQTTLEVEISVVAGGLREFDMVNVVVEGNLLKVTGETSGPNDYMVYFEIAMSETGVDVINPTFELTLISTFFPSTQGFEDFTSNITVNTDGTLTGTFSGTVTNADGGDLSLTSGMINITY
ncbi:MAG: hypothetical protein WA775_12155 [Psychroserpens sp.]|uniref:hypothetical protein n=1 Tax=Psychroserpens sp. TaxID=2020870 RepID=UPI003C81AD81